MTPHTTVAAVTATSLRQRAYNVTSGSQITFAKPGELVPEAIPEASIELGPGPLELDQQGPFGISAAARDPAYRPTWPVERGIPDYVA